LGKRKTGDYVGPFSFQPYKICEYVGLFPAWRKPLTETQRHGENFLLGTPTSSSASSTLRYDSTATPRNPIPQNTVPILALAGFKRFAPEQETGMDLNEPWITALRNPEV